MHLNGCRSRERDGFTRPILWQKETPSYKIIKLKEPKEEEKEKKRENKLWLLTIIFNVLTLKKKNIIIKIWKPNDIEFWISLEN